jgi:hypothetical protein
MNPDQQLAGWLTGSSYRAFHCEGCTRPIVVARIQWRHPVYILTLTAELGAGVVAHCAYQRCRSGIAQHSTPVNPNS